MIPTKQVDCHHKATNLIYSQTSLYRTQIIRTSAYIENALWSQPPAIVKSGKMHWIYGTRIYRILGSIEYAALPRTCLRCCLYRSQHIHV